VEQVQADIVLHWTHYLAIYLKVCPLNKLAFSEKRMKLQNIVDDREFLFSFFSG